MTRWEFDNEVRSWWDLMNFCYENNCDLLEDVIDEDTLDEYVNEYLNDIHFGRDRSWQDISSILQDIPTGYSVYRYNYIDDIEGLDDYGDFTSACQDVLTWALENDIFEDEDEDEEEQTLPEEEEEEEEDPLDLSVLFGAAREAIA